MTMTRSSNSNTALCILGMHRSGTSTITRAINLLGVYLGPESGLMEAKPDNPEGFWELLDIYYLHERLLAGLKRDWATPAPLPDNWHSSEEIRPFRGELIKLIRETFSRQPLWAWKDPRTCLLLPLWRDVLSELKITLKVVFVLRNPLDVANSLKKRNGIPLDKGWGIWFNNTLTALQGIDGLETYFLSYDRFLGNWEDELRECSVALGIPWPAEATSFRANMASFVRHDLRHSVSGLDELYAVRAPEPVIRLFMLLSEVLSGARTFDAVSKNVVDAMYNEFFGYARFFEFDISALADFRARATESPKPPPSLFTRISNRLRSL